MSFISILGCGWLGLALAEELIKRGFKVKGSTTTTEKISQLQSKGIEAYEIELPNNKFDKSFFDTDYLIIDIPPKSSKAGVNHHFESIKSIIPYIKNDQKIIYISSTSVYPDVDHPINEDHELDKNSDRANALIQVEQLLLNTFYDRLTIIRSGGLLGYDRIPGKYFAGKKVKQYDQKVNYLHRDDAVGIIITVIDKKAWGCILNAVAPQHPTRKEVYKKNADDYSFEYPIFENTPQELTNRIIENSKIEQILDYSFIYPDPLHFFYIN